jgi:hypothetical protein
MGITLAKIYLTTNRRREGLEILKHLLQRNPTHELAIELARQARHPKPNHTKHFRASPLRPRAGNPRPHGHSPGRP